MIRRNFDFMTETIFQISRFVFLLFSASAISILLFITLQIIKRRLFREEPRDLSRREIRELLHSPSEKIRWQATRSLLAHRDEKSLPKILESVSHSGRFGLVQLQPDLFEVGREGVFSLEEALQHPEPDVRMLALGIVGRLKQAAFIRFITRLLEDPILDVRMKALGALVDMSSEGKKDVKLSPDTESILSERLSDSSWEETARILQVIGAWKLKKFIPEVENQVTNLHPWVRYRALATLLQLGPDGRKRVDVILSEYRHIVFPILEDLDVKNDIQD